MKVKKWYNGYYTTKNDKRVWVNGYYKTIEIKFPTLKKEDKKKMTIKNLHIKHLEDPEKIGYYLCNHAVGFGFKEKLVEDIKNVTCNRCESMIKNSYSLQKFIELKRENFVLKSMLQNKKTEHELNQKQKLINHLDSLKDMIEEYPYIENVNKIKAKGYEELKKLQNEYNKKLKEIRREFRY